MQWLAKSAKLTSLPVVVALLFPAVAPAQHYVQKNLISNVPGTADHTDANLKNPWGLTRSPSGSPWWIADNGAGVSTLNDGSGIPINIFTEADASKSNFVVVPPPGFAPPGTQSTPTGVVFNGSPTDFILKVNGVSTGKPGVFIFATEDGTISGWNPEVGIPAGGSKPSPNAVLQVDNSDHGSIHGAVYKGLTSGDIHGHKVLYVSNFRSGEIEVYDTNFHRVHLDEEAFKEEHVPHGFAPFNVQNIGGSIFVTFAKQDPLHHDDVAGDGLGFVDIFSTTGKFQGRLEHGDWFNSPWGVVWTPRDFGEFSNVILVGNFGSGKIAAFNGFSKQFIGFVRNPDNSVLKIDGLWSLTFGNNGTAGPSTTLFFTAGINDEKDGLFGSLTPVAAEQDGDEE